MNVNHLRKHCHTDLLLPLPPPLWDFWWGLHPRALDPNLRPSASETVAWKPKVAWTSLIFVQHFRCNPRIFPLYHTYILIRTVMICTPLLTSRSKKKKTYFNSKWANPIPCFHNYTVLYFGNKIQQKSCTLAFLYIWNIHPQPANFSHVYRKEKRNT